MKSPRRGRHLTLECRPVGALGCEGRRIPALTHRAIQMSPLQGSPQSSHRTDLAISEENIGKPQAQIDLDASQSHRTDLVISEILTLAKTEGMLFKKSQSHRTDLVISEQKIGERALKKLSTRSRNPTVLIWSFPRAAFATPDS